MDKLQQLVFSFYRENLNIQEQLEPLRYCRMTRSWGTIRVECLDVEHLEVVSDLVGYIRPPLAALGLGRKIVLRSPGSIQRSYPIKIPFHSDLLA
ncbi:hypothetical protein [Prochlorococcus sp. MIT 1341]|uniref:hypothetical protein n=1 Tax=Prochlorococcus sp. MIT 1341 TaxID=3096221 RepID=UPI002A7488C0|nr:hypothetical protein [Prochlorococcus sp. MIT 1341]